MNLPSIYMIEEEIMTHLYATESKGIVTIKIETKEGVEDRIIKMTKEQYKERMEVLYADSNALLYQSRFCKEVLSEMPHIETMEQFRTLIEKHKFSGMIIMYLTYLEIDEDQLKAQRLNANILSKDIEKGQLEKMWLFVQPWKVV